MNSNRFPLGQVLVTVFFLALISCNPEPHKEPTDSRTEAALDSTSINGVFAKYYIHDKEKPTLFFIHGWCIDQNYWEDQVREFLPDFNVVTVDLPGFGKSERLKGEVTIEKYGEAMSRVISELGLKKVIPVGHSMGGNIAVETALANSNVVAVVGVDNFKDVGAIYDEATRAQIDDFLAMLKNDFSTIAPAYAEGSLFHQNTSEQVRNRVMADFARADSSAAIAGLMALLNYGNYEADRLKKLDTKLYLINCNQGSTLTAGLDSLGLDYELAEIDSCGHFPMVEKPEEFNSTLRQTLEKIVGDDGENKAIE